MGYKRTKQVGISVLPGKWEKYDRTNTTKLSEQPITGGFMGIEQSITSELPKGSKMVMAYDSQSHVHYPPVHGVTLDKTEISSVPVVFQFYLYADAQWLHYNNPYGLGCLIWLQNLKGTVPPLPSQSMKDRALASAMSRISDSPFEGAVELGELDETVKFMKSPFKAARDHMLNAIDACVHSAKRARQLRRAGLHKAVPEGLPAPRSGLGLIPLAATPNRRPRKASTRLAPRSREKPGRRDLARDVAVRFKVDRYTSEVVADTWMEYRYALGPALYTASDLAETAALDVRSLIGRLHSARGAVADLSTTVDVVNGDWFVNDGTHRRSVDRRMTTKNMASYTIRYVYYPWMIDAINLAVWGVSPTQLLSTGYELLKLSWVLDWFWNFGDWIRAMEPKPQLKIIDVCYSHKYEVTMHANDRGGSFSYYSNLPKVQGAYADFTRRYLCRTVETKTLQAPIPRLKGKALSVKQTLDSIALISRPVLGAISRLKFK